MSFNVLFGTVYKRHNSTFRGASGSHWLSLACTLKEECSINSPSLLVDIAGTQLAANGNTLNHCYIAYFDRYYFVDNWTYERGRWRADCSIDVLATWRETIGNSSQYILRSASDSDGTVFDSMYPVKNVITTSYSNDTNPWGGSDTYVIGAISGNGMGVGCVGYYAMSAQQFRDLCNYLFGYVGTTNYFDVTEITKDMTMDTFKAIYNPFQYICSAMYLPFSLAGQYPSQQNLNVGYWTIPVQGGRFTTITPYVTSKFLPWSGTHPNDNRGSYVYCNPYTRVDIDFQPFGHFQLPSDIVYDRGGVQLDIYVDTITGKGTCYVGGVVQPIMTLEAQVGVPIKLSQMVTDYLGIANTVTQGVANTVGSIMKGDVAGAIANGVSGIDSALKSQAPTLSTLGSNGGFSSLTHAPTAVFTYYSLVDEDNTRLGRPLCKQRTINTLSGYILCENASVETGGTYEENQQISQLMNTGFYYE